MPIYVGLDCGGSSTRVLAIDTLGNALFRGQSGAANLTSTAPETVRRHLSQAAAGCPVPVDAVVGCFAGLIRGEDRERAETQLRELFPTASKVRAEPDYVAALYACDPQIDACVIAGTGSVVCSMRRGMLVKSGGRGLLLGDRGSAAQVGRRALLNYLDAPAAASDRIRKSIEDAFGSLDEPDILAKLYGAGSPAARLATLAQAVGKDAYDGDPSAQRVVSEETQALAQVVVAHLSKIGQAKGEVRIGTVGGLWKASGVYKVAFKRALEQALPDRLVTLEGPARPAVEGAAWLARETASGD